MDIDGNNQKQLTAENRFATGPVCSNDGKLVVFQSYRSGRWSLWNVPIDDSPAKTLTKFYSYRISRFDWTRDGKQLILSRGPQTDDVVLIKDFR